MEVQQDGPIKPADVAPAIRKVIDDLTRAGIEVPATLYLAAIVLAVLDRRQS